MCDGGVTSTTIYCKNFGKCQNIPQYDNNLKKKKRQKEKKKLGESSPSKLKKKKKDECVFYCKWGLV
jgi:hypothetical protein